MALGYSMLDERLFRLFPAKLPGFYVGIFWEGSSTKGVNSCTCNSYYNYRRKNALVPYYASA